jgi:transposase-like protein
MMLSHTCAKETNDTCGRGHRGGGNTRAQQHPNLEEKAAMVRLSVNGLGVVAVVLEGGVENGMVRVWVTTHITTGS